MKHAHPKTREQHHIFNGKFLERFAQDARDNKLAVFLEVFAMLVIAAVMLIPLYYTLFA